MWLYLQFLLLVWALMVIHPVDLLQAWDVKQRNTNTRRQSKDGFQQRARATSSTMRQRGEQTTTTACTTQLTSYNAASLQLPYTDSDGRTRPKATDS
jgi:hypothetical protein